MFRPNDAHHCLPFNRGSQTWHPDCSIAENDHYDDGHVIAAGDGVR